MAFKCYALFFLICFLGCRNHISVRSAAIQNEYPIPVSADVTHEANKIPQIPIQQLPSSEMTMPQGGVTMQQGDVQILVPIEKVIPLEKLDSLFGTPGFYAKFKGKSLKVVKKGIKALAKLAVVGVVAFAVVAASVAMTVVLCKKTGLCVFKFNKKFKKKHVEAVRSFVSDDRLTNLTKFVMSAIDEYSKDE